LKYDGYITKSQATCDELLKEGEFSMLDAYQKHVEERKLQGIVPLPLNKQQTTMLVELLKKSTQQAGQQLLDLLIHRVPPGVDPAAQVKAAFLANITTGKETSPVINPAKAVELLGTMLGGYNVEPLIDCLDNDALAPLAADALSNTLLMFEKYQAVLDKAKTNPMAQKVVDAWTQATWFTQRPKLPEKIACVVFRVDGEINTDDLSPATQAWSRPDIPLHAKSMLVSRMDNPLEKLEQLKKSHPDCDIVFVGDVVGTGSSRKSATNSLLWHIGKDIPFVPNKRSNGLVFGGKIAPIFFTTLEDSGALPIELDVSKMAMGDLLHLYPYEGKVENTAGETLAEFELNPTTLSDEVRAGGRIPLIIGRTLTNNVRTALDLPASDAFVQPKQPEKSSKGYTLAQKMIGRACGLAGVRPGQYCEPKMTTAASQDTTGAMTRDELKELACLKFADVLVLQSFCHTAAYPRPVDIQLQHSLPTFFTSRGGVALKPGDGIIHSWVNRMLLPDTVGTGGDSHTRFPIGISFPSGSGLTAFAAAIGNMPLNVPESVLVRFKGKMRPGITLRDLVNMIPYIAIQRGLLTVEKEGKKNVFSGRMLEIEGLPDLKVEQAFELADASAERSANGCTIHLNKEPVIEYVKSNIALLNWLLANGYENKDTLSKRVEAMQAWLKNPELLSPDSDAEYVEIIEIDLDTITEPVLACPNDPDNVKLLSEITNDKVDEVFLGSCMTNIGHYRAASKLFDDFASKVPVKLWIAPPTTMDAHALREEGVYASFAKAGARMELPGCSLCMGNQARVADKATVVSTSTRNFPGRMGKGANVYLCSAELAAITATYGRLPTVKEYHEKVKTLFPVSAKIYRYLNFDQINEYNIK
jgi:aconitate hydratase 2 / 2-methylisocitrate dehydratase